MKCCICGEDSFCWACDGSGKFLGSNCSHCDGSGHHSCKGWKTPKLGSDYSSSVGSEYAIQPESSSLLFPKVETSLPVENDIAKLLARLKGNEETENALTLYRQTTSVKALSVMGVDDVAVGGGLRKRSEWTYEKVVIERWTRRDSYYWDDDD